MITNKFITWGYVLDCCLVGGESPTNRYYATMVAYVMVLMGALLGAPVLGGAWFNPLVALPCAFVPLAVGSEAMCLLLFLVGSVSVGMLPLVTLGRILLMAVVFTIVYSLGFLAPYAGFVIVGMALVAYAAALLRR